MVKKGNAIDIEKTAFDIIVDENVSEYFDKAYPVCLNLQGKGILYKQLGAHDQFNATNFNKILPGAVFTDFYIQLFNSGNKTFLATIRKTEADRWISLLVEQGFKVLMLNLGPFPVQPVLGQMNFYGKEFVFDGNMIMVDESGNWLDFEYDPSFSARYVLKVGLETLDQKIILPYASAFQLILNGKVKQVEVAVAEQDNVLRTALKDRRIKVMLVLVLLCVFFMLLINFMVFSWLYSTNEKLGGQIAVSSQNVSDLQGLQDKIKRQELLLHDLGWDKGIDKAMLLDQLASLLPIGLTWAEVDVNPIDLKNSKRSQILNFNDHKIRVSGFSEQVIPVNEWMARIKTKKWVKSVELENYSYNSELNTGQFIVLISY
ncbi:hypothetical protein [Mucilaginibacter sp.]|uniref:hypothetical protein n=1 Tax=Mucilaginibacter sp. TaxID=1882438 RepID=UPI0025E9D2D2|nr:hypothetical protein [Mucilaginibacter sp.]